MKKVLLIIAVFMLVGCTKKIDKFYLEDKYYNIGDYINVNSDEIEQIKNDSMIIYTYNNFCNLPIHCETIFKEFMIENKIDFISIPYDEFKNTSFGKEIAYAPSVLIVNHGKIVDYLEADSDDDYDKYQKVDVFKEWLEEYVYLTKATN